MSNEEMKLALEAFDVTIEGDAAKLLLDMVSPVLSYDEPTSIRLVVGDGHSGYGLYAACAEYQEEGAVLLVSTTPPKRKPLTDAMVSAAARVLNDRQAQACGVDKDDQWKIYGQDFIEDARAMLEAAHGIKEEA